MNLSGYITVPSKNYNSKSTPWLLIYLCNEIKFITPSIFSDSALVSVVLQWLHTIDANIPCSRVSCKKNETAH